MKFFLQWAITAACKDQLVYDTSKRVIIPKPDILFDKYINIQGNEAKIQVQESLVKKIEARVAPVPSVGKGDAVTSSNVMDIFSPVNKG